MPVQFEATTAGGGALSGGGAIGSSAHLARLLMWLDAYASSTPGSTWTTPASSKNTS
ncbi:hypothetical protein [Streptomyces viridosporus]|uniref:hypothetical protein n=1 Tax=Streptomyces viridosporus TaxID=67581 RepID=UPI001359D1F5|nr:hypothetical protein [Streptomyces viridosporus]